MIRRTAFEMLRSVTALALVAGAPIALAAAQGDSAPPQASEQQQQENPAQGGDPPQQADPQQPKEESPVQLKIIELKHVSYGELLNLMRLRDENYFRGGEDVPVHVSHDVDSNTLFLRAPKPRLDQIEQFISQMDVPPGEFPKEIAFGDQAIGKTVSSEVADRATRILEQLGYPVSVQNFADQRILVIRSDQQAIRDEVMQVVERFTQAEQDKQPQPQSDTESPESDSGDASAP